MILIIPLIDRFINKFSLISSNLIEKRGWLAMREFLKGANKSAITITLVSMADAFI